ncbi:MAG: hypothetical protein ABJN36_15640 [Cyclobacteriaceae bacterium]
MHSFFLLIHIAGGTVALLSGLLSLLSKKGSTWHIRFGLIFFYSMIIMAGMASFLAAFSTRESFNLIVGLFTIYLVLTSRQAIVSKMGTITVKEKITGIMGLIVFGSFLALLIRAFQSGQSMIEGVYLEAYFVFTMFSCLALVLDIKILAKGGVYGKHRTVRHVWRMLLALFIATASAVYGQPQIFPDWIHSSEVLNVVVLLILISLLFWVVKIFVGKKYKRVSG